MIVPLKVALLGTGAIGDAHLTAIANRDDVICIGIAEIHPERCQEVAERVQAKGYTDYKQMIDELRPDIAIIALPHFLHKEAALYCIARGCHLLIEKPMALTSAECDEIIAAAADAEVTVFVGHTQQFLPYNLAAKQLIEQHDLGELIQIIDRRYVPYFTTKRPAWFLDPALSGGGIVANLGVHAIDKIQWLTDSPIKQVKAALSFAVAEYPNTEGSATMLLKTESGVACTVNLSGYEGVSGEETELLFTKGAIKIINYKSLWLATAGRYEEVAVEQQAPFQLQLSELVACIREKREPYCSGTYGRSVVQVVEAVYHSHRLGKEVEVGTE